MRINATQPDPSVQNVASSSNDESSSTSSVKRHTGFPWGKLLLTILMLAMIGTIGSLLVRVDRLEAQVDYITPLAENGNRYAHSHYSDARLKENVRPLSDALERVLVLRGVYFDWNKRAQSELGLENTPQVGLIAQEVEQVYPELVTVDADGYKQVDYAKLTPILVEALKQQELRIQALSAIR